MKARKIISIILGIIIIGLAISMPFFLGNVAETQIEMPASSLSPVAIIELYTAAYTIIISILTLILVLLNVTYKEK